MDRHRKDKESQEAKKWSAGTNARGDERRQAEEEKRSRKMEMKKIKKALEEAEDEEMKGMKAAKGKARKAQRANASKATALKHLSDVAGQRKKKNKFGTGRKKTKGATGKSRKSDRVVHAAELRPNLNRERSTDSTASDIDSALVLMTSTEAPDRHPERRAKAAYRAFEEREMIVLKTDYPGLRRTQLKELLFKKWKTSPENPMNRAKTAYNSKAGA